MFFRYGCIIVVTFCAAALFARCRLLFGWLLVARMYVVSSEKENGDDNDDPEWDAGPSANQCSWFLTFYPLPPQHIYHTSTRTRTSITKPKMIMMILLLVALKAVSAHDES